MSGLYIPVPLRQLVYERAAGCCEYCLLPETVAFALHQIDHIVAQKHGGQTEADNLALACALCNKHKGTDLTSIDPLTDDIVRLYHPRRNRWGDHFQLVGAEIAPLTPIGRATVRLLHLNRAECLSERELLIALGEIRVPE